MTSVSFPSNLTYSSQTLSHPKNETTSILSSVHGHRYQLMGMSFQVSLFVRGLESEDGFERAWDWGGGRAER